MTNDNKVKFIAIIEQHEGMDAAYIRFPYDVKKLYGMKGQVPVKAIFNRKVTYTGSLVKMGTPCHILGITQDVRQKLGKSFGDTIKVEIVLDTGPRVVSVPDDIAALLEENPKGKKFFGKLSYTNQKEYIRWIENARQEETRTRRIGIFIDKVNAKKKFLDI